MVRSTMFSATRIAAILADASEGNAVSVFNAVKSITGLKVGFIRADAHPHGPVVEGGGLSMKSSKR